MSNQEMQQLTAVMQTLLGHLQGGGVGGSRGGGGGSGGGGSKEVLFGKPSVRQAWTSNSKAGLPLGHSSLWLPIECHKLTWSSIIVVAFMTTHPCIATMYSSWDPFS